ncbi:NAD(P)-dependent alcohol dehydrogenase [Alkalihalobacillus sp. CinArs1]|uniref:NAD(P)-dependent alcohol dehydrogenase n=1 Tax=Alkalihalobacillus sp. CinArs1 TaxID=2995314 RepID=UPI0022DD073D|nr:NAD(P)-dependent alcohol dehydrogenase [Alkalihalobacillus sp. CinArs1]
MKAVVCERYGAPDVLQLKEVEKPVIADNEVLIKVHATTVSSGDARIRRGTRESLPFWPISKMAIGFHKPRKPILGMDFAGEIVEVGNEVKRFKIGDHVFGFCGQGTYAEYIRLFEEGPLTHKPPSMTFEEAASIPFGGCSALDFLRKGKITSGQNVLIYGASGSLGTYAVQLAKYFGADVTAVCSSTNVELVKSLGADAVIDYTKEDFVERGERYDIIFDTVGKTTFSRVKDALKQNGLYVLAVFHYREIFQMIWTSKIGSKKVIGGITDENVDDLRFLKKLIEKGKLKVVIDRCYPIHQIAEAHEYVEQGHKKGNVVMKWEERS